MDTIFLDTETTGLNRDGSDRIVEIAIVDAAGSPLMDTLINPGRRIPPEASRVHGITAGMVASAPRIEDIENKLLDIISDKRLVIYNAAYDLPFLPDMVRASTGDVDCCMIRFADHYGEWDSYHGNNKWKPLDFAARFIGYEWTGKAHRAMADALACRAVWYFLDHVQDWKVA